MPLGRLPSIKELYSLVLFSGLDVDPESASAGEAEPFLDRRVFDFADGDPDKGERNGDGHIDADEAPRGPPPGGPPGGIPGGRRGPGAT